MLKKFANKFRSHCGSVQSVDGEAGSTVNQSNRSNQKERLQDNPYLLHAGFASARRHSMKST